jgi:ADP-ribose pyrophosphatase
MTSIPNPELVCEGKHVRLVRRGTWEFVTRKKTTGIVGIIAITDEGKLLLVEQPRAPIGTNVVELPAGLAGDVAGQETEELASAAHRELLEETGYAADKMEFLADGTASAGIADEIISLFRATGLRRVGVGEGDGSEQITLHEVEVGRVPQWLTEQRAAGKQVDLKVYGALYFARQIRDA